jgi:glycyl-tRNA synthetase
VLISVMKKHQRYFPAYTQDGGLLPYFIAVRNGGSQHLDVVADGNEQVIRARFADAAFFIGEDLKHKLEENLPRLGTLTFQFARSDEIPARGVGGETAVFPPSG